MIFARILNFLDKPEKDKVYNYLSSNVKFNSTREWFGLSVLFILGIFILILLFTIKYYHYEPPTIYQVSKETLQNGTYKERLLTLGSPRATHKALHSWSINAVNNMYNFDFNNFENQLKSSKVYFTDDAYRAFKKSIDKIGLMNTIVEKKQIVTLTVSETPKIIRAIPGGIDGKMAWQLEVNAILTVSAGIIVYKNILIEMIVVLENSNKNSSGLFIKDMKMS